MALAGVASAAGAGALLGSLSGSNTNGYNTSTSHGENSSYGYSNSYGQSDSQSSSESFSRTYGAEATAKAVKAAAEANAQAKENWGEAANYNDTQARESRAWQEMMSNTAYQRAVQDMIAAGINPVLAVTNGGASTPGGATASMTSAQSHMANTFADSVSAASSQSSAHSVSSSKSENWSNGYTDGYSEGYQTGTSGVVQGINQVVGGAKGVLANIEEGMMKVDEAAGNFGKKLRQTITKVIKPSTANKAHAGGGREM
ncbi:minor capsid protein [Capybara microvirus Cap3_SP_443]|nr:minor capsid protein [Capybara microvirus Cap3_SP_443]